MFNTGVPQRAQSQGLVGLSLAGTQNQAANARTGVRYRQHHFGFSEKISAQCSYFVLACFDRTNIIRTVPYRYGARSDGHAAWNGTRRSASFAGPGRFRDLLSWKRTGRTTAKGADGTSECPGVSTHERGAEAPSLNPGTSSKPTNPSVCGTPAKAASEAFGPVQ